VSLFKVYARALRYLGAYKLRVSLVVIANIVLAAITIAEPILFGRIIDAISGKGEVKPILFMWAGFAVFNTIAFVLVAREADRLAHGRRATLLTEAFGRIISMPLAWHQQRGTSNALHTLLSSIRRRVALGGICLTLLGGCATPPFEPGDHPPSHAFDQPERSPLARLAPGPDAAPRDSNLRLLITGQDAFAARAVLSELAEHTLDLQYHLVAHDDATTLLLQRLLRAAKRGVRVRLLVDDIGTALPEADLTALSLQANVQVRLFNPFRSPARCRACWS